MKRKDSNSSQDSIDEEFKQLEDNSTQAKKVKLMPKRRDFRSRAHANPLQDTGFSYPLNPDYVDWKIHYPKLFSGTDEENKIVPNNESENQILYPEKIPNSRNGTDQSPNILDVGCGYGGLLFSLSKNFPDKLILGLEIRDTLVQFISQKIKAMRIEQQSCNNVGVLRTNAMRHMCNYFRKSTIEKMFFCFPDPHFKQKNKRKRIINLGFLSECAFLLKPKARIYCITDVLELHEWHVQKLTSHNQFRILTKEELEGDVCLELIHNTTEEGQKVDRKMGDKYYIICERI